MPESPNERVRVLQELFPRPPRHASLRYDHESLRYQIEMEDEAETDRAATAASEIEVVVCAVCLEAIEDNCVASGYACEHTYHYDCLMDWVQHDHDDCPQCRRLLWNPLEYQRIACSQQSRQQPTPLPVGVESAPNNVLQNNSSPMRYTQAAASNVIPNNNRLIYSQQQQRSNNATRHNAALIASRQRQVQSARQDARDSCIRVFQVVVLLGAAVALSVGLFPRTLKGLLAVILGLLAVILVFVAAFILYIPWINDSPLSDAELLARRAARRDACIRLCQSLCMLIPFVVFFGLVVMSILAPLR